MPIEGYGTQRLAERIEVLDGARPRDRRCAAVRQEDLQGLMQVSDSLKSAKAAGALPTAAEFEALVEGVHMLHRRLIATVRALQARLI